MRKLRFGLEALGFRVLLWVASVAPRRFLLAAGSLGGSLGYWLDARHRRITIENLELAFGDQLSPKRRRRLARACWQHFGRITLDTLCFSRFGRDDVGRLVRYEGLEHARDAYARGKGVLIFSGHFGHWELVALMQGFLDLPMALVARPLDNPLLETLLARLRSHSGNRVVHKRQAVREMLRALHAGIGVAIMIDQDAREHGVFVPFLGRPASTTPTLAHLALRTGAAIVPVFGIPEADGTYRIVYEPEVRIRPTGDMEHDLLEITAECSRILEGWVQRYPQLWLWMHRRWKTRPDEQPVPRDASPAREAT